MTEPAVIAGLSLAGALLLGVPLRLFGWRAVWGGFRAFLGFLRRYRWRVLLILIIGAIAGLWTFEDARQLVFGLFFRLM